MVNTVPAFDYFVKVKVEFMLYLSVSIINHPDLLTSCLWACVSLGLEDIFSPLLSDLDHVSSSSLLETFFLHDFNIKLYNLVL